MLSFPMLLNLHQTKRRHSFLLGVVAITGVKNEEAISESALKLLDYLFVKKKRELMAWSRPMEEWLPIDLPWQAADRAKVTVDYPLTDSVFPPDFLAPTFLWVLIGNGLL
jgi:hypothetical protein